MKRAILTALFLFLTLPLLAFDRSGGKKSIGIITHRPAEAVQRWGVVESQMPKYLVAELRRAGYAPHLVNSTVEDLRRDVAEGLGPDDQLLIDIVYTDASNDGGAIAAVGSGSVVGEFGIGVASITAEVRVYDGATLELRDSFTVSSTKVAPTLTGAGLGGRSGFLFVALPFFANQPYRYASRTIAHDAATRILGGKVTAESKAPVEEKPRADWNK